MRLWLIIGSSLAFLAVMIGAMGAHALKPLMNEASLSLFLTANQYHFWHSMALILVGILINLRNTNTGIFKYAGVSFLSGIILFSGNLYFTALQGDNPLHFLIPIGGGLFLLGWLFLIIAAWKIKN